MMDRLCRYERAKRLRRLHRGAARPSRAATALRRWSRLLAACAGVSACYAAVLVTAALGGEAGTLLGVLIVLAAFCALAISGIMAKTRHRRTVALWAAAGVAASLFPATLAAAAMQASTRYARAAAALAAAPGRWAAAAGSMQPSPSGAVPVAYLALERSADVYAFSDAVVRLDLMGRGLSYWPLCVRIITLHLSLDLT